MRLSFGRMVERRSDPPKGEPASWQAIGSARIHPCEASQSPNGPLEMQRKMSNSTKIMEWTVRRIQEGDYGCEERAEEERNQVIVTLENEDGLTRQLTADDDWLNETGIDEGSLWPEEVMPAALEKNRM